MRRERKRCVDVKLLSILQVFCCIPMILVGYDNVGICLPVCIGEPVVDLVSSLWKFISTSQNCNYMLMTSDSYQSGS